MKDGLRIVFFGTPEFAVASLDALVHSGNRVVAVVTAPDKPAGRGLQISQSAVKEYALGHDLLLLQPEDLNGTSFLEELKKVNADLQVVVAFRIMPREVWSLPPCGTFNLHSSLLPDYRGAAPINWAVINGEKETGVTTFFLEDKVDTGNIIFQEKTLIGPDETAGALHDRLMVMGAELVVKTTEAITTGTARQVSQHELTLPERPLHRAPKIHKEDCRINWQADVGTVHNLVRGLSPYPGAFTEISAGGQKLYLKIFMAEPEYTRPDAGPGSWQTDTKSFMKIAAYDGYLNLQEVQLSGRRPMGITEFLRGFGKVFS
jgi:methionyl-tRNA formyltransferase